MARYIGLYAAQNSNYFSCAYIFCQIMTKNPYFSITKLGAKKLSSCQCCHIRLDCGFSWRLCGGHTFVINISVQQKH